MPDSLLDRQAQGANDALPAAPFAAAAPRHLGLRFHLTGIVLAALLPCLVAGGIAIWTAAEGYQRAFEAQLRDTARALALAVGADIRGRTEALTAFATSPAFGNGSGIADPVLAHAQAGRIAAATGMRILVADVEGRFLLHHQVPPGAPLPDTGAARPVLRAAILRDRPVVSGLIPGPLVQRPVVFVIVPVPRTDGRQPMLSAGGSIDPEHFDAMLAAQGLVDNSFAGLIDAGGTIIARSDGNRRGVVLPESDTERLREAPDGLYRRIGPEGEERLAAHAAVPGAPGWTVVIGAPYAAHRASWERPLFGMLGGIAVAFGISSVLALILARRIERPLRRLADHAQAVALDPARLNGTAADLPASPIAELDALRRGFAAAEAALHQRMAAEREAYAVLAEKEAMLATAQQLTSVGGWTLDRILGDDPSASVVRWTDETYRIFGFAPGSVTITPMLVFEAIPPEDRPRIRAALAQALATRQPFRVEHRIIRPDGTVRIVEALAEPESDGAGRVHRIVGSCQDVTERRLAEATLADNAERLQELLSTLDLAAFMARDLDGTIRFWSAGCERLYGWSAAEALGRVSRDLLGTVSPVPQSEIQAALERDGEWMGELRHRRRDGEEVVVVARKVLRRDAKGRPVALVESVADVTALHAAREALAESEARLRSVVDSALDAIIVATQEGVIVSANRAAARIFRHPGPEALIGRDLGVLMPAEEAVRHRLRLVRMADAPDPRAMAPGRSLTARRADGSEFPIEASVAGFEVGGRRFVTGILRDVSDRIAAEQALAESEAEFRATFDQAAVGIAHVAPDGTWLRMNDRFCAITGYSRATLMGLAFHDITHPDDLAPDMAQAQALLAGRIATYSLEKRYIRGEGGLVWVNLTVSLLRDEEGRPERFISVIEDISARKAAEAALAESEFRYRTLFERMEEGFVLWEAMHDVAGRVVDFRLLERNNALDRVTGGLLANGIGRTMRMLFPDMPARWFEAHVRAAETGEPQVMEEESRSLGRWLSVRIIRPAPGRVAVLVQDVTARVAAEAALRHSEAMLRRVLDNLFAFVGVLAPDGTLLDANRAPLEAAGIELEDVRGRPFWEAYWWSHDPAMQARIRAACERAAAGESSRFDVEVRMEGDSRMVIDFQIAPLRGEAGRITHLIPSAVDITERKRSEEAKMLLAREVDHRAKNALAVVQSVLTLTRTEDPAAFKKAVIGRITAMALAHTLLARERWNGADLQALLAEELAAYRGAGGLESAVQLDGPLVGLMPDAVQPVAMAIHELATNAAKYGALSVPGGRIHIGWSKDPEDGGLVLNWREQGGPPIGAPPVRSGFGTSLIQSTVVRQLQGRLDLHWEPSGLRCVFALPARQVRWRSRVVPRPGHAARG